MKKKKYWYKTDIYFCVLCGKEEKFKQRIYSKKPKSINKRFSYHEVACWNHFL